MRTSIAETFEDGTVLVTGGTGFLGKLLLEKLLRSCSVKNIAVFTRNKKGLTAEKRISKIYNQTVFDRLRSEKWDFMNNIKIIEGNLENSTLSLSSTDRKWLIENVNFIFHCAATIRFNEPLETATKVNIQGTEHLLKLAAEITNLKGFVHVSTAYSHCPRYEIKEQFYPVPITASELIVKLKLNQVPPNITEGWPNTYTFTKAITEDLISKNENRLPISVFRPSIVGSTKSEPIPGWLENMNGPSGVVTGVIMGLLRVIPMKGQNITDIVPADNTINALIGTMWDTVNRHQNANGIHQEPKIYNYVSSVENPLTWNRFIKGIHKNYNNAPPLQSIWYIFYIFYKNLWIGQFFRFWFHWIPSSLMDFLLIVQGKNSKVLKTYAKLEGMISLLYQFTTNEWKFENRNTREVWSMLNQKERALFDFGFDNFNWDSYIEEFYFGVRKYVLHENLDNIPEALSKNRKLFWLHQLCIVLVIYFTFKLFSMVYNYTC